MPIADCIYDRGQFFLPMSLNGSAPHYFIVDTGAGVSAVDASLAVQLGLPTIAHTELAGTAGVLTVDQVRIQRISPMRRGRRIDDLSWFGLTPTVQDLGAFHVPEPIEHEAGLLGNDYLQNFVLQMQFDPPLLEIARPNGFAPAGVDPERFIPFWLDQNTIVRVRGQLDGWMDVELRFDTGSSTMTIDGPYLNVTTAMWEALRAHNPDYELHDTLKANAIGGEVKLGVGRIRSLDVGPLHFDGVSVVVQPAVGYFANPGAVGFIALNLFQRAGWITFDYPNSKLYL